jgi:hypothetical protein
MSGIGDGTIVYSTSMRTAHVENMLQRGTVACRLVDGDRMWARQRSWSHGKEIDWARLCLAVCALQRLFFGRKEVLETGPGLCDL